MLPTLMDGPGHALEQPARLRMVGAGLTMITFAMLRQIAEGILNLIGPASAYHPHAIGPVERMTGTISAPRKAR